MPRSKLFLVFPFLLFMAFPPACALCVCLSGRHGERCILFHLMFLTITFFVFVFCGDSFIDEGNPIAGGHGDFKEDETTTLYWNMIKLELDDSAYDR